MTESPPLLTLNQHDIFAYTDSGAPEGVNAYTTFVVIHGFGWHGACFRTVQALASSRHCRIVAINRRDYPGSKPLAPSDLNLLNGEVGSPELVEGFQTFMKERSAEFVEFLDWFVKKESIPPVSGEGKTAAGGVVITGWSAGNHILLSVLASVNTGRLDSGLVARLEPYIRRFLIYDGPYHAFGIPPPAQAYNPLFDASLPPGELVARFAPWASGYFDHHISDTSPHDPASLEYRTPLTSPPPTIVSIKPEDIATNVHLAPAQPGQQEDLFLRAVKSEFFKVRLQESLLFPGTFTEKGAWKNVGVSMLWCTRSLWEMPIAAWGVQSAIRDAVERGEVLRPFKEFKFKGVNHFAHWEEPERAIDEFIRCVEV